MLTQPIFNNPTCKLHNCIFSWRHLLVDADGSINRLVEIEATETTAWTTCSQFSPSSWTWPSTIVCLVALWVFRSSATKLLHKLLDMGCHYRLWRPFGVYDCFVAQPEVHSFVLACKNWGECRASPWLGAPQLRKGLAGGVLTTPPRSPTQHAWRDFPTDRSGLFTAWWNSFRHHTESPQGRLSNCWASTAFTVKQPRSGCKRRAGFIIWGWGKVRPIDQTCSGPQPQEILGYRHHASTPGQQGHAPGSDSETRLFQCGIIASSGHTVINQTAFLDTRKIKKCRRCRCQRATGESWARIRIWHASDLGHVKKTHNETPVASRDFKDHHATNHKPSETTFVPNFPSSRSAVSCPIFFPQELFN